MRDAYRASALPVAAGTTKGTNTMNMIYANTARFDTGRALTEDEMHRLAPSIFGASA